jgi:CheY-like chemotaxis protein
VQVLSVDDDPINQMVASTLLKSHNWSVVKAMTGLEALEYLTEKSTVLPDLVLLDVMMPGLNGYDAARRIREVYPSSQLPIIMVSVCNG